MQDEGAGVFVAKAGSGTEAAGVWEITEGVNQWRGWYIILCRQKQGARNPATSPCPEGE